MKLLLKLLPSKYQRYVEIGLRIADDLSDDGKMSKKNWALLGTELGFTK